MGAARKPVAPIQTVVVAIVDTETTGLGEFDEPITVGIVLCEVSIPKGYPVREVGAYYGTREPGVVIHPRAFAVHGIGIDSLRGTTFNMPRLRALFSQADYVIAHNCAFDARMLIPLIPELASKSWRCSFRQISWTRITSLPNGKLDTICGYFGIRRPSPHNALDDCRALLIALIQPTGKTDRSRTFLGIALAQGDFIIGTGGSPSNHSYEQRIEARFAPRPSSPPRRLEPHPFEAMRAAEEAQAAPRRVPEPESAPAATNPLKGVLIILAVLAIAYVIAGILR